MKVYILVATLCFFGDAYSLRGNGAERSDLERSCREICSNPNWEVSFEEKGSVCLCWVDSGTNDLDVDALKKRASGQGFALWVINNRPQRTRRHVNATSTGEAITTRLGEIGDEKVRKPSALKKYAKPNPTVGKPRQTPSRGCTPDALKAGLQGLKLHVNRLFDRAGQPNPNCALLLSELETVRTDVQQLATRIGERQHERPKLIDQIKERQARIQSRLGHLDLPKRPPSKLNLVGANRSEAPEKSTVIAQPKLFIDDQK